MSSLSSPSVAEILRSHVARELEGLDRISLNVYVPKLQYPSGVATFLRYHRGAQYASSVLLQPISDAFIAKMDAFTTARQIPPGLPLRGTLGSATGGTSCAGSADFVQTSHRVTLSPVTTSKTFQVTLCDDGASLPPKPSSSTELFQVRGFSPSNATLAQSIGVIAIQAR